MSQRDLEDFLPFLVNRVSARLVASFSQAIADRGLSIAEARTLSAILFKGDMRLAALSEATDLQLSTLSRLVRRLEERGLCTIEARGADERAGLIALTPVGREAIAEIADLGARHERALVRDLDGEDLALAKRILRKLYQNALEPW